MPPSVLTCTVPVSLPIVALPLARLRLTVVAPVALLPERFTVLPGSCLRRPSPLTEATVRARGGVADRAPAR